MTGDTWSYSCALTSSSAVYHDPSGNTGLPCYCQIYIYVLFPTWSSRILKIISTNRMKQMAQAFFGILADLYHSVFLESRDWKLCPEMFWRKTYYLSMVTGVEILPNWRLTCNLCVESQNRLIMVKTLPVSFSVGIVGRLPGIRKILKVCLKDVAIERIRFQPKTGISNSQPALVKYVVMGDVVLSSRFIF